MAGRLGAVPMLPVAVIVLAVQHVRSKRLVGGLAAVATLAPFVWPSFFPLAVLARQLAVCLYVIFHQAVWPPDQTDPLDGR